MKRKKGYLLLISLCLAQIAVAQKLPSGYMGQVNYVYMGFEGGISSAPNRVMMLIDKDWEFFSDFKLVAGHVFSDKFSLEATYTRFTTSSNLQGYLGDFGYNVYLPNRTTLDRIYSITGTPKITGNMFGLNAKFYLQSSGALSPLGFYFATGLSRGFYKVRYDSVVFRESDKSIFAYQETRNHTGQGFRFSTAIGMTRAIGDRILVDFGTSLFFQKVTKTSFGLSDSGFDEFLNDALSKRVQNHSFSNVYLQVGLAF